MAQIVTVGLYAAEGDAAQAVDFDNVLRAGRGGADVDVGFFADADLVADGVKGRAFQVRVEGEVVEAAVGEAVAIVWKVGIRVRM